MKGSASRGIEGASIYWNVQIPEWVALIGIVAILFFAGWALWQAINK